MPYSKQKPEGKYRQTNVALRMYPDRAAKTIATTTATTTTDTQTTKIAQSSKTRHAVLLVPAPHTQKNEGKEQKYDFYGRRPSFLPCCKGERKWTSRTNRFASGLRLPWRGSNSSSSRSAHAIARGRRGVLDIVPRCGSKRWNRRRRASRRVSYLRRRGIE